MAILYDSHGSPGSYKPPDPSEVEGPPADEPDEDRSSTPIGFEVPPTDSNGNPIVPSLDHGATYGSVWTGIDSDPRDGDLSFIFREERPVYYPADLDIEIRNIGNGFQAEKIQASLVYIGLLNKTDDVIYGEWDNKSRAAFEELLAIANHSGTNWNQTLTRMLRGTAPVAQPSTGGGGGGRGRAAFQAQIPNREEVRRGFSDVRSSMLGGRFAKEDDPDLVAAQDEFGQDFENEVVAAQRAAYDGRTVEQAPSLQSAAEVRVERDEKAGVDANLFRGYADAMTRALGRG